jgi:hypothetical protein
MIIMGFPQSERSQRISFCAVHRPVRITKLVGWQLLLHRAELIARTPRLQPHPQTTRDDSRVRRYVLCMRHNATPFRFPVKTIEPMTV